MTLEYIKLYAPIITHSLTQHPLFCTPPKTTNNSLLAEGPRNKTAGRNETAPGHAKKARGGEGLYNETIRGYGANATEERGARHGNATAARHRNATAAGYKR
jgi:hypothetical protein